MDLQRNAHAQVALELSRNNMSAAVDALRKYLDVYANDKDAWEQLGELYLQVGGCTYGWRGSGGAVLTCGWGAGGAAGGAVFTACTYRRVGEG